MRHLNKILVIAVLLITLLPSHALGQQVIDTIQIKKNDIHISGDSIYIDLAVYLKDIPVKSKSYIALTPELISPNGQTASFPRILINGKKRNKLYNRSANLHGVPENFYYIAKVGEDEAIRYNAGVAYSQWMNDSRLVVLKESCGCAGNDLTREYLLLAEFKPTPLIFSPVYIAPPVEVVKNRDIKGEAFVIFPVGKYILNPDLANNAEELAKIRKSIDYVSEVPRVQITKIMIDAYASPEGNVAHNITLSENRAKALVDYITYAYQLDKSLFSVSSKGENWEGLRTAVSESTYFTESQKQDIVKILDIENVTIRKQQLKSYQKGQVYQYLLANVYPQLRRSDYKIEYVVPAYTTEEAKSLISTKPSMLSLEEMYLVANSYDKGSNEFNEVFEIAVRLYPQDMIANLNAAATALDGGNPEKAEKYLTAYMDNPQAYNNIGIMYALKKDFEKAEYYIKKAVDANNPIAKENLKILLNIRAEI